MMAKCEQCGKTAPFMASLCDECINEQAERMQASVVQESASAQAVDASSYLDRPMSEGGIQPGPPPSAEPVALYLLLSVAGLAVLFFLFGGAILLIGIGPIALLIILAAAIKIIVRKQ